MQQLHDVEFVDRWSQVLRPSRHKRGHCGDVLEFVCRELLTLRVNRLVAKSRETCATSRAKSRVESRAGFSRSLSRAAMSGSSSSWSAGVLGRRLAAVRRACARVKTRRSDPGDAAARRQPATLAPLDELVPGGASTAWSCVCLSTLLPAAALTVAGVTSAYVTGPAAILSVLLAAAAVSLAGIWSRHTHTHTHTHTTSFPGQPG